MYLSPHKEGDIFPAPPDQILWFSSGDDPEETTAYQVGQRLNTFGLQPHFIYHPVNGFFLGMVSLDRQARAVKGKAALRAVQVVVVSRPDRPFTQYECPSLSVFLDMLPPATIWPNGPVVEGARGKGTPQAPGSFSGGITDSPLPGIGSIDIRRLTMSEPLPEDAPVPEGVEEISQDPDYTEESFEED